MTKKLNINDIIRTTTDFEDEKTRPLFNLTPTIKKQGYLTKDQAIKILKWKSPRPLNHYNKNSDDDFKQITKLAFEQKDEKVKIHILTALIGVKYPAASALLMFYDQKKYPIIDIRVWRQLHNNGLVKDNAKGQAFTLEQWNKYLTVIRQLAEENKLTARQVEKRLFDHDRKTQSGTLYKTYKTK
ncbi:MAG TPA: hypothetical protein PLC76_11415 [Saprospiraceae bacterium]|nr:hypothetical protein [Saprospiraceae bacterium]HRN35070.1 hypothetical protein [Saprospiraceae bacterium]HRP85319.1 hypothetical protein [Saprospiraceae bacterium]